MALRSVLRKMPALALRSPAMGPLTGPARALSRATGSRLMSSQGVPIDKLESAMEEYRRELARSHASIDESMRIYKQGHQTVMKKLDITDKACNVLLTAYPAALALMIANYYVSSCNLMTHP